MTAESDFLLYFYFLISALKSLVCERNYLEEKIMHMKIKTQFFLFENHILKCFLLNLYFCFNHHQTVFTKFVYI